MRGGAHVVKLRDSRDRDARPGSRMGAPAADGGAVGRLRLGRRWCEPALRLVVRPSRVDVVVEDGSGAAGDAVLRWRASTSRA